MASVLELQAMSGAGAGSPLEARSSISVYKCGKKDNSSVSVAWCGTNLLGLRARV
ncbi:MAG: SapB/AmfS family lantipeptide [Actinobacteria bacterium]|nr:SapB/AmfS family lantipeptide [Actinomycetota bacterium]